MYIRIQVYANPHISLLVTSAPGCAVCRIGISSIHLLCINKEGVIEELEI